MHDQGRANHADPEDALAVGSAVVAQLLSEDRLLDVAGGQTAVLARPSGCDPSARCKLLVEGDGEIPVVVAQLRRRSLPIGRQGLHEEVANLATEGVLLWSEAEVHVISIGMGINRLRTARSGCFCPPTTHA